MLISPAEDVHLHMWPKDAPEPIRHRLFRDWLRSHPEDRDLYAAVKRRLARDTVDQPADYSLAKNDVIDDIYARTSPRARRQQVPGKTRADAACQGAAGPGRAGGGLSGQTRPDRDYKADRVRADRKGEKEQAQRGPACFVIRSPTVSSSRAGADPPPLGPQRVGEQGGGYRDQVAQLARYRRQRAQGGGRREQDRRRDGR